MPDSICLGTPPFPNYRTHKPCTPERTRVEAKLANTILQQGGLRLMHSPPSLAVNQPMPYIRTTSSSARHKTLSNNPIEGAPLDASNPALAGPCSSISHPCIKDPFPNSAVSMNLKIITVGQHGGSANSTLSSNDGYPGRSICAKWVSTCTRDAEERMQSAVYPSHWRRSFVARILPGLFWNCVQSGDCSEP